MTEIGEIIEELRSKPFYGESEIIEIAKGKYEYANTWKQLVRKVKRATYKIKSDD